LADPFPLGAVFGFPSVIKGGSARAAAIAS
jgi:hypothetical protein